MNTPEVRIYFSWQLNNEVSGPLQKLWGKDEASDSEDTLEKYAVNYRQTWAKYQDKILPALVDAVGVDFYKSVIDVPCTPWLRQGSEPLVMSFSYVPDQFVDALTHELGHVLLTDNTVYSIQSSVKEVKLAERWAKMFGEHSFDTLVHIPVHALSKYIYLDILNEPQRLERDVQDVAQWSDYKAAWDYVNTHDYKKIIDQLKQDYQNIQKELAQ